MPTRNHAAALDTIVEALRASRAVIAIGAYGSTADQTWTPSSDVDLLVILNEDPAVESVRLRVVGVPVDINLRSIDGTSHGIRGASFVPETTALWDPEQLNSSPMPKPPPPHQTPPPPGGEAGFVVRGYYQARALWFPGPVRGLRDLADREPELLRLLLAIASGPEPPSTYLTQAAELALAPVGGLWRDNELFVAAWTPSERSPEGEIWVQRTFEALLSAGDEHRTLV